MKTSRIVIAALFLPAAAVAFVPDSAPIWVKSIVFAATLPLIVVAAGFVTAGLLALGSIAVEAIRERARDRKVVREVPSSNGIQVLGTFLSDSEGGTDR
jgi:hypothetical protein